MVCGESVIFGRRCGYQGFEQECLDKARDEAMKTVDISQPKNIGEQAEHYDASEH